jgi:hypothetical protein
MRLGKSGKQNQRRAAIRRRFRIRMWQASRAWLTKDVADLRENFVGSFRGSIADVFEQMLYFLAFATDSALSTAFKWHC